MAAFVGSYAVEIKPSAQKELDAAPDATVARLIHKMESLRDNPRPTGCKKLKGFRNQWRVRVGDWRVLYIIDDSRRLISVTRIAHRREVYE